VQGLFFFLDEKEPKNQGLQENTLNWNQLKLKCWNSQKALTNSRLTWEILGFLLKQSSFL